MRQDFIGIEVDLFFDEGTCKIPKKIDQNIDVLVRLMNLSFMLDFWVL